MRFLTICASVLLSVATLGDALPVGNGNEVKNATAPAKNSTTAAQNETAANDPFILPRPVVAKPTEDAKLMFNIAMVADSISGERGNKTYLSSLARGRVNTLLGEVNKEFNTSMELAWGPAIQMEGPLPEGTNSILTMLLNQENATFDTYINLMYVAHDTKSKTYYVGIAGTNSISAENWILEDFMVDSTVNYLFTVGGNKTKNGTEPALYYGTSVALHYLLGLKSPVGSPAAGLTLAEYLTLQFKRQTTPKNKFKVRVAGHSLGGTLAPVLGLYLSDIVLHSNITTTVNIYAGVTPGNVAYAEYYKSRPVHKNTATWANALDIVPYAFATMTMNELPDIYKKILPLSPECVEPVVNFVNGIVAGEAAFFFCCF